MACLYACCSEHKGLSIVKFGISKFDDPWSRLATHAASRDNPFRARLDPAAFLCIVFPKRWAARDVETALRSTARSVVPRCSRAQIPDTISLPVREDGTSNPSGEWLFGSGDGERLIAGFYSLALHAVRASVGGAGDDGGMYAHVYERLYRATTGFLAGDGYATFSLNCRQGPRGQVFWS